MTLRIETKRSAVIIEFRETRQLDPVHLDAGALPFSRRTGPCAIVGRPVGERSLPRAFLAMAVSDAGGSRAMPASTLSGDAGVTMEHLQASGAMAKAAAEMDDIAHAELDRGARTCLVTRG